MEELIRGDQSDPFVSVVAKDGCKYLYRSNLTKDSLSRFLNSVLKGSGKCVKSPLSVAEVRVENELPVPWHVFIGGIGVAILSIGGVLLRKKWRAMKQE
jgi:hypothetical protein